MKIAAELIEKYSLAGPRYTSYPTAVEFSASFDCEAWLEAIVEDRDEDTANQRSFSFYFHLPFCQSLCYFCACNKVIARNRDGVLRYLEALAAEIALYQSLLGSDVPVQQVHWGGGTPNYLKPREMEQLFFGFHNAFSRFSKDADVSVEIDPRTILPEHFEMLRGLGFNRVSFGVQDFDPRVQQLINRVQPFEMTADVCELARARGFNKINIDLIYGLPDQTLKGFSDTIDKIIQLRPERIALYGYAHVTWIKKVQKALERAHLPTPSERVELFCMAHKKLCAAGYCDIGMDHFALPEDELSKALHAGTLNRNFMGYSTHHGARVIGMGMSGISTLPGAIVQNSRSLEQYEENVLSGILPIERGLRKSEDDKLRADVIERLLCQLKIDIPAIEKQWNIDFAEYFAEALPKLKPLIEDGLLEQSKGEIRLTADGRLFSRHAAMVFDAYLEKHRRSEKPVFSQAV